MTRTSGVSSRCCSFDYVFIHDNCLGPSIPRVRDGLQEAHGMAPASRFASADGTDPPCSLAASSCDDAPSIALPQHLVSAIAAFLPGNCRSRSFQDQHELVTCAKRPVRPEQSPAKRNGRRSYVRNSAIECARMVSPNVHVSGKQQRWSSSKLPAILGVYSGYFGEAPRQRKRALVRECSFRGQES